MKNRRKLKLDFLLTPKRIPEIFSSISFPRKSRDLSKMDIPKHRPCNCADTKRLKLEGKLLQKSCKRQSFQYLHHKSNISPETPKCCSKFGRSFHRRRLRSHRKHLQLGDPSTHLQVLLWS